MIELIQPLALLALASIPIIIVLHFLRPRRRAVRISSTALWREALEERQRRLGLARLLRDLALLLMLLFALLASLAVADPRWLTRTGVSTDVVLVLDVSASMQTRHGVSDRFALAVREAERLIDRLPDGGRMLIMTSGRRALIRSAFESDRDVLRSVLAPIAAGDEAGRPDEALTLALSLLRNREQARVYFVTDGAFEETPRMRAPQVRIRTVGEPARNVAITQFDLRPEIGTDERYQLLLSVRNYTSEPLEVPAEVALDDQRLLERTLDLEPASERTIVLEYEGTPTGRATARIEVDDDLSVDNAAFAAIDADEVRHVLLVSPGNLFLDAVLSALPGVNLTTVGPQAMSTLAERAAEFDVVVLDGIAPSAPVRGRFLLVNTLMPGLPITASSVEQAPSILGRGRSALVSGIDLKSLRIERGLAVTVSEEARGVQRLMWSDTGALALAVLEPDLRAVYLGFDIARSDLPLKAAFPLLMTRVIDWLADTPQRSASGGVAAGTPHTLRIPGRYRELTLRHPSGDAEIHAVSDGEWTLQDSSRTGIYRYTVGGIRRYFAVNLTDEVESDLTPRAGVESRRIEHDDDRSLAQVALPLWPWLAMLALAALVLEWIARCSGGRRA